MGLRGHVFYHFSWVRSRFVTNFPGRKSRKQGSKRHFRVANTNPQEWPFRASARDGLFFVKTENPGCAQHRLFQGIQELTPPTYRVLEGYGAGLGGFVAMGARIGHFSCTTRFAYPCRGPRFLFQETRIRPLEPRTPPPRAALPPKRKGVGVG